MASSAVVAGYGPGSPSSSCVPAARMRECREPFFFTVLSMQEAGIAAPNYVAVCRLGSWPASATCLLLAMMKGSLTRGHRLLPAHMLAHTLPAGRFTELSATTTSATGPCSSHKNAGVGSSEVDTSPPRAGKTGNGVVKRSPQWDEFSWTALISRYAKSGQGRQALKMYDEMRQRGVKPTSYTYVAALRACSSFHSLESCKQIHAHVAESGLELDVFVGTMLVDAYAKCGSLQDARRVFEMMPKRDVFSWTAMILGYAQMKEGEVALQLYARMKQEGLVPNDRTFVGALKACSSLSVLELAVEGDVTSVKKQILAQIRSIHSEVVMGGFESDVYVGTMLVDVYAKCGNLVDARHIFEEMPHRNVVSWTAMILGYAQMEDGEEALRLYARMQHEGVKPNDRTFVGALKACSSIAASESRKVGDTVLVKRRCLDQARGIHSDLLKRGSEIDTILGTILMDAYAKCGSLEDARQIFDNMRHRDSVSWNSMIMGYAQAGVGVEALELYARMQLEGAVPNDRTFIGVLMACANVGALQHGKEIHIHIQEQNLEADVTVGSSLINLYSKCGRLVDARTVFDRLPSKNVVTWNVLLYGYAKHCDGQLAMQCFEDMRHQGIEPDAATFTCLFVACSHGALVAEGRQYFKMMVEDHGIVPSANHYSGMVDLLGRSGHLDEAEDLLLTMPFEDDGVGWTSLLGACRSHGDIERGRRCFDHLISLEPKNAVPYVLLGNIYANAGRWAEVHKLESLRKSAGARKKPAKACIEVGKKVHEFTVGEGRTDISSKLGRMNLRLKDEGSHMPHSEVVLKVATEKEKEDALCGHAEKLALAFGLLNTPDGSALLVTKNLRMCNDCHSSTKIMSRLEKREITVRDACRVHHFVDGCCSCGDQH